MKFIFEDFKRLLSDFQWEYTKDGIFTNRKNEFFVFCIQIQKYSFKMNDKRPYTFNFSIICPELYKIIFSQELYKIRPEIGIVDLRPYEFLKSFDFEYKEFWFVEDFYSDWEELKSLFIDIVIPFFQNISTYRDLYNFIIDKNVKLLGLQKQQFEILVNKLN